MTRPGLRLSHLSRGGRISSPAGGGPGGRQRGAVLITVSICLTLLMTITAIAVDLGRVSARRRDLQATADALAMDLVRQLGGRTSAAILADPAWGRAVDDSRARNSFGPTPGRSVAVSVGTYDAYSDVFTPATGVQVPKAVQVTTTDTITYAFLHGSRTTSRSSIAVQTDMAGFSIGSIGAALSSSDSALLNGLLGDALDVSAISYSGLAGGQVKLALLATALGLDVGNPNELLSTNLTLVQVVRAEAQVLRLGGDLARATLLDQLAVALPNPSLPITLGQLMDIETGGENAAAVADVDALRLLTATALVANGTNFLRVPNLGVSVPGLAGSSLSLQVIEKPQFVFGPVGSHVQTSQVNAVAGIALGGTVMTGITLSGNAAVTLNVANGAGTINAIGCGGTKSLTIGVQTSLVSSTIAITGTISAVAPVVNLDLGLATTDPSSPGTVTFTIPPDQLGTAKRYIGSGLGLAGATVVRDNSTLVGLSLLPVSSLVAGAMSAVVNPALGLLDGLLTGPINRLLGLSIADADVTPLAVACASPQLAR